MGVGVGVGAGRPGTAHDSESAETGFFCVCPILSLLCGAKGPNQGLAYMLSYIYP